MPPELIFDAGFGELFIVRVAGNVLSQEVAGSLQYAGAHLKTNLFLVMGHDGCGAVQAALDSLFRGKRHCPGSRPSLMASSPGSPGSTPVAAVRALPLAVEADVRQTMRQIFESPEGRARRAEGRLHLAGAVYDIESGRVRFLPGAPAP